MTTRKILLILFLIMTAIGLGYAGYDIYSRYISFSNTMAEDAARAVEIAQNRTRTLEALEGAGISAQQVTRGFWYTSKDERGNESLGYFDSDAWALQDELSEERIAMLAAQMKKSQISDRDAMRQVPDGELPANLRFHNKLYSPSAGEFQTTEDALYKAFAQGKATTDELWQLSYIYELRGEYAKRDEVNAANCKLFKQRCASEIPIVIHGTVVDIGDRPVQGASITVLSHPEIKSILSNERGTFSISVPVREMEKVRISAVKRNFSEGGASVIVVAKGTKDYEAGRIVLGSPITIVTLDTEKHTITDERDEARADGSFVVRGESSTYEIPAGAIVRSDGTPYKGQADVYLYEFTRETVPANLVTLDTFDEVMGYAGNLMQSFGMPYIQFFAENGEELHVLRSKPMLLTYRISGLQDLKDNTDRSPFGPLTDAHLKQLIFVSRSDPGFPITSEFLIRNDIPQWPPWWVYDRKKGVWTNEGMRVLDMSGTIQSIFYTHKDN